MAACLIGITAEARLATHPLRGALFENLVVMELVKHALHRGEPARLHCFRDSAGLAVDLVVENGMPPGQLVLVDVKSGQTFQPDHLRGLHRLSTLLRARVGRRMRVNGGGEPWRREGVEVVGLQARAAAGAA